MSGTVPFGSFSYQVMGCRPFKGGSICPLHFHPFSHTSVSAHSFSYPTWPPPPLVLFIFDFFFPVYCMGRSPTRFSSCRDTRTSIFSASPQSPFSGRVVPFFMPFMHPFSRPTLQLTAPPLMQVLFGFQQPVPPHSFLKDHPFFPEKLLVASFRLLSRVLVPATQIGNLPPFSMISPPCPAPAFS